MICDSNIMEFETMRYQAMQESSKSMKHFKAVVKFLCIVGILSSVAIAIGGCLQLLNPSIKVKAVFFKESKPYLNTYVHIGFGALCLSVMIAILVVVLKLELVPDTQDTYESDLTKIASLFRAIRSKVTQSGNVKNGPWERYRAILTKRIAQTLELDSTELAGDMLNTYIDELQSDSITHNAQILKFIEFHTDRDYNILRNEMVPLAYGVTCDAATPHTVCGALDRLQSIGMYDPMPKYQESISAIYSTLFVATILCVYGWLRVFSNVISIPAMVAIFMAVLVLTILYMRL